MFSGTLLLKLLYEIGLPSKSSRKTHGTQPVSASYPSRQFALAITGIDSSKHLPHQSKTGVRYRVRRSCSAFADRVQRLSQTTLCALMPSLLHLRKVSETLSGRQHSAYKSAHEVIPRASLTRPRGFSDSRKQSI